MIRIANWLLTRKCNLNCDYCAIVKNYEGKPSEYPDMKHYIKNEMSTEYVINGLAILKKHNPDMFHIFYGGEPLLRKDLVEIINYCNHEDIHYTIISNNTLEIQPFIFRLTQDVTGKIKGFTASVDPVLFSDNESDDSIKKSLQGFASLINMKRYVKDVVAEITVMKHNVQYLYKLVKLLSENKISSDITFIDIQKSLYYDFSNITDYDLLVRQTAQLAEEFKKIHHDTELDVHMKDILLKAMWDNLPSNMDCEIEKNLHNISIDADGSIRLCLRIRGVDAPKRVTLKNLIKSDGSISPVAHAHIKKDKREFCKLCNHTCHIMSKTIDDKDLGPDDLVHLDRRSVDVSKT